MLLQLLMPYLQNMIFISNSSVNFNCVTEKSIIRFIKTEAKIVSPNEAFTTPVFVGGLVIIIALKKRESQVPGNMPINKWQGSELKN